MGGSWRAGQCGRGCVCMRLCGCVGVWGRGRRERRWRMGVAHWFLRQRPHSLVGWCSDVSRERGPAEPRNMLQICTYNPLTASTWHGCRLEEILFTLQTNHVIFLTGTKRPRAHCFPVTHMVLAGCRLFRVGPTGWDEGHIDMQVSLLQSNWTFAKPGKSVMWPLHKLAYKAGEDP